MRRLTTFAVLMAGLAVLSPRPAAAQGWSELRSAALPVMGWRMGVSGGSLGQMTFFDAVDKTKSLRLLNIEGAAPEKVSGDIAKNLDENLSGDEIAAVKSKLRSAGIRMPAYAAATVGPDEAAARKLFDFAKALGVETIIADPAPDALPLLDKLSTEYGINVALAKKDPREALRLVENRGKRMGVCADLSGWAEQGIKPAEGLALLKDRIITMRMGRSVTLGPGAAGLPDFLRQLYHAGLKPTLLAMDVAPADLSASVDYVEKALRPAAGDSVDDISRNWAPRSPSRLSAEQKQKVEAAVENVKAVRPKKPRKLLVVDLNVGYGGGHRSIPAANYMVELLAKKTGAFEPVFSSDMANLRWPKIKQFDAIYLNNTVGMIFVAQDVRDSLLRYMREGGGLAGNHGTPHASMDWPAFSDMLGAKGGAHHDQNEKATVKIDDPTNPINAAFGGKEFVFQDEFFRWQQAYSREKLHVLLSIDVEKTDMNQPPPCSVCDRPDNDYAISWIRKYGKGRIFYCSLGHNNTVFETPALVQHFLSGFQFILGDLKADATPSAKIHMKSK